MSTVIYTPAGRAREYAERALNLYTGCSHGCTYCYAPAATFTDPDKFRAKAAPRPRVIERLQAELAKAYPTGKAAGHPPVLLCFTCDPYQPADEEHQLTRQAIDILHAYGIGVHVLTKGGMRASRDFDLLGSHPDDAFATTMTFLDSGDSLEWEPGAALPAERVSAIRLARGQGIPTWVSLEPVIDPEQSLQIIRDLHGVVDLFKVGTLNHHPLAATIDWPLFASQARSTLKEVSANYYLKRDLRAHLRVGGLDG